jgi:hypothetical protein
MSTRRITLIALLSAVLMFWAAYLRQQNVTKTYQCHILPDKLVINTFENDVLIHSLSLSSNRETYVEWRKGMRAAEIHNINMIHRDYGLSETPDHKRLLLKINQRVLVWYQDIPNECYDAI